MGKERLDKTSETVSGEAREVRVIKCVSILGVVHEAVFQMTRVSGRPLLDGLRFPRNKFRLGATVVLLMLGLSCFASAQSIPTTLPDTLEQRLTACTACHGTAGRATSDGYYPRIAGKPAGYLYNQLVNFREGRRRYPAMIYMVNHLSDAYLQEIAGYFSSQHPPYPSPQKTDASAATLERGKALTLYGDSGKNVPACIACHGANLTGAAPAIPGLVGLPRDYLNAQFGAWKNGTRHAAAPDCMVQISTRLSLDDINAVAAWLSSRPLPTEPSPAALTPDNLPMSCGSVASTKGAPMKGVLVRLMALVVVILLALLGVEYFYDAGSHEAANPVTNIAEHIARGKYLVQAGDCMACHSARGGAMYAGGRPLPTPFGTMYSPNITSDVATGIGSWTADEFLARDA